MNDGKVSDLSRLYPALDWSGDGVTAASVIRSDLQIEAGVGNRVMLFLWYDLLALTGAASEIVDIEVFLEGNWQATGDPAAPDRVTSPLDSLPARFVHMDVRPTQSPLGYQASRHEVCWEMFKVPDLRRDEFSGDLGVATAAFPVIVLTSPATLVRVGLRFTSFSGPATAAMGRVGEYVRAAMAVGGLSQGF